MKNYTLLELETVSEEKLTEVARESGRLENLGWVVKAKCIIEGRRRFTSNERYGLWLTETFGPDVDPEQCWEYYAPLQTFADTPFELLARSTLRRMTTCDEIELAAIQAQMDKNDGWVSQQWVRSYRQRYADSLADSVQATAGAMDTSDTPVKEGVSEKLSLIQDTFPVETEKALAKAEEKAKEAPVIPPAPDKQVLLGTRTPPKVAPKGVRVLMQQLSTTQSENVGNQEVLDKLALVKQILDSLLQPQEEAA